MLDDRHPVGREPSTVACRFRFSTSETMLLQRSPSIWRGRSTRVTLECQPSSPPGQPLGRVLSRRACRRGRISYDRALILALAPRSSSGPGGDSNLLLLWCRSAHRAIGVDHQRTVRANSGPLTSRPWRVVIRALRKAEQTFRVDVLRHPKLPISMSEQQQTPFPFVGTSSPPCVS